MNESHPELSAHLSIHECTNTGLLLPVPYNWSVAEKTNPNYSTCIISRENRAEVGICFTEFTVATCHNYQEKYGVPPSSFNSLARIEQNIPDELFEQFTFSQSDELLSAFLEFGNHIGRLINIIPGPKGFLMIQPDIFQWPFYEYNEIISNDRTDTSYYLRFQTPISKIEQDVQIVQKILGSFRRYNQYSLRSKS